MRRFWRKVMGVAMTVTMVVSSAGVIGQKAQATTLSSVNYQTILGDAVNFGVTADKYVQGNHAQTNYAVVTFERKGDVVCEPDLINGATIPFYAANITNGVRFGNSTYKNVDTDSVTYLYHTSNQTDITKITSDNQKIHLNIEHAKSGDDVSKVVNNMISHVSNVSAELAGASPTIVVTDDKIRDVNHYMLDTTARGDNEVIYINVTDGSRLAQVLEKNEGLTVKKKSGQVLVFNILGNNVKVYKIKVIVADKNVELTTVGDTSAKSQQNVDLLEYVDKNFVWNMPNATDVEIKECAGIFLAPTKNSTVEVTSTSSGWVVSAGTVKNENCEWHFPYILDNYTEPGTPSGGESGSTQPSTPSGGESGSTKPGTPSGGESGTTQPSTPSGGESGSTKPSTPSGGESGSTKPSTPSGGESGTTQPGTPSGGEPGSTKPGTPSGGESGSTKPSAPSGGESGVTQPDTPGMNNSSKGDLTIIITDEKTDDPVPGAAIEVTTPTGDKTEHVTDSTGTVTIKDTPAGDYSVVVTDVPKGYTVTKNKKVTITVEKGQTTEKRVSKNATDAKNAKKALRHAADVKTGSKENISLKEQNITRLAAKNAKTTTKNYNKNLKKYKKKHKKQAKEVAAWITIKGTRINYPVMYTGIKNNTKYLHKNIDGKKDSHGMLFASYITPKRRISYNNIIYGHNMKDGSMFAGLNRYASKSFFKKHKYVKLDTAGYNYVYEVVDVFRISCAKGSKDRMIYEKFAQLDNKKVYKKWKKQVAKNREYNCGGKYNSSDELLILSTCEYSKENGRLAILCKQVKCKKIK